MLDVLFLESFLIPLVAHIIWREQDVELVLNLLTLGGQRSQPGNYIALLAGGIARGIDLVELPSQSDFGWYVGYAHGHSLILEAEIGSGEQLVLEALCQFLEHPLGVFVGHLAGAGLAMTTASVFEHELTDVGAGAPIDD